MDTVKTHVEMFMDEVRYSAVQIHRPAKCPRCNAAIGEIVLSADLYSAPRDMSYAAVSFLCNSCFKPFVCVYEAIVSSYTTPTCKLIDVGPSGITERQFDERLVAMSERFPAIYNQAFEAEQRGLTEVCGMAYGKALEFLVKDFAITKSPADKEKIADMRLALCIENYVDDDNLKATASRCAWLRNDHTHYVVKHDELSLSDLKNLLEATMYWVNMRLLTDFAAALEPICRK